MRGGGVGGDDVDGIMLASDAEDVARVAGIPERSRVADVGLRGDEGFEGDVARGRRSGEELVGFVVWRESRPDAVSVLLVVLVEGVVEGDGVVGVVERHCPIDGGELRRRCVVESGGA